MAQKCTILKKGVRLKVRIFYMDLSHFFEEKNVQYGKDYSVHIEDTRGHTSVQFHV